MFDSLPKPFLLIHIPKTAGSFLFRILLRIDTLHYYRWLGLDALRQPHNLIVGRVHHIKRRYRWPHSGVFVFKKEHQKYHLLLSKLKHYPCVVMLRNPEQWYASYLAFFMKELSLFSHNEGWYKKVKAEVNSNPVMQLFVDKYLPTMNYDAWQELLQTNVEAFLFFIKNIRLPEILNITSSYFDTHRVIELDYMTCTYVWSLDPNPAEVLSMNRDSLIEYFESNSHTKRPAPLFPLRYENMNQEVRDLLVNEFNYDRDIVDVVFDHAGVFNRTPPKKKARMLADIRTNAVIQQEIKSEFIRYYQGLAS